MGYLTVNILGILEITFYYCHNHNAVIWEPNNANLKFDLLSLDNFVINIDKPTHIVVMYYDENGVYCFNRILGTKPGRIKDYRIKTRVLFYPTGNYSWDLIFQ